MKAERKHDTTACIPLMLALVSWGGALAADGTKHAAPARDAGSHELSAIPEIALKIVESNVEAPGVEQQCRGTFVVHNVGPAYRDPPPGFRFGPSYGVFVYDAKGKLLFRNFGSWGPGMKKGQKVSLRWNTSSNHLGKTSEPPFVVPAPGRYRLEIVLYIGNRDQVLDVSSKWFEVAAAEADREVAAAEADRQESGLVLMLQLFEKKVTSGGTVTVRLTAENRGKQALRVVLPPPAYRLREYWWWGGYSVSIVGPDGQSRSVPLPKIRPPQPPLREQDTVVLSPDGSAGMLISLNGCMPRDVDAFVLTDTPQGTYSVVVTYAPKRSLLTPEAQAKATDPPLWVGRIKSNVLKYSISDK